MKTYFTFLCLIISGGWANATTQTSLNQDKPPLLYVKSYTESSSCHAVNNSSWDGGEESGDVMFNENFNWTNGSAGGYSYTKVGNLYESWPLQDGYWEQDNDNVTISWPDCFWPDLPESTSYETSSSSNNNNYYSSSSVTNTGISLGDFVNYWEHCNAKIHIANNWSDNAGATQTDAETVTRRAQTVMKLKTGGKATSKLRNLFGLWAFATRYWPDLTHTEDFLYDGYDGYENVWDGVPAYYPSGYRIWLWPASFPPLATTEHPYPNIPFQNVSIGSYGNLDANGYRYVVLPDNADVDVTPGVAGVEQFAFNMLAQKYPVVSQCVATTPANRARTTIGVGEQVDLGFNPTLPTNAIWSTTAGDLSTNSGTGTRFTAPDRAADVTVTATVYGDSISRTFKVIEPSWVYYVTNVLYHTYDEADIGFHALIYLKPDSVNFGAVQCQEEQAYCVADGVYSEYNGSGHQPYQATDFGTTVVPGRGTGDATGSGLPNDTCYSGATDAALHIPYTNGTETLVIPWDFKVGNDGIWKTNFTTLTWLCSKSDGGGHGDGLLNASKSNASVQMNVDDLSLGSPN